MELEQLKQAWQVLDERLARRDALSSSSLREGAWQRMRHGLRPLQWGALASMTLGVLGTFYFAPYWLASRNAIFPLLAGLLMHAYCIGLIVFGITLAVALARIDYAEPVATIQQRLLRLRRTYVVGGWLIGLPWWFLEAPLCVIWTDGAIMHHAPWVIGSQLAVGVLGLAATFGFYRWAHRPANTRLGLRLDEGMAGGSIRRAQLAMDDIVRFRRE